MILFTNLSSLALYMKMVQFLLMPLFTFWLRISLELGEWLSLCILDKLYLWKWFSHEVSYYLFFFWSLFLVDTVSYVLLRYLLFCLCYVRLVRPVFLPRCACCVTLLGWKCGANVVKEYTVLMFQLFRDQVSFSVVFLYVQWLPTVH